jgi:thiosulfate/3-mercaptopyruvate sulfurtransferase
VSGAWLRERLGDARLVVVDCRFVLGSPGAGRELWSAGRVPGAAFLDVDGELSGPVGDGSRGRHPLPAASAFASAAGRAGISEGRMVVAYDEAGEGGAARLWWLLRHFGHPEVAVLDGGLRGWRAAGGPVETGAPSVTGGSTFVPRERTGDVVSASELARPGAVDLVDARAPERFRGEVEPIDPVAGHIPGAVSAPTGDNVGPDDRFLAPEILRTRFAALGVSGTNGRAVGVYCGSGITAAHEVLALELAGIDAALYAGSWSEWITDPARPVATGD